MAVGQSDSPLLFPSSISSSMAEGESSTATESSSGGATEAAFSREELQTLVEAAVSRALSSQSAVSAGGWRTCRWVAPVEAGLKNLCCPAVP